MRKNLLASILALAPVVISSPAMAEDIESSAGADLMTAVSRRLLTGDVVEYSVDVRVGPGAFDVIGLHRVVRESAPRIPIRTSKSVMMVHGDVWGFESAFLAGDAAPASHSVAVYLAQHDVDVWGIDLRWTRVPAGMTHFGFMSGWGIGTDVNDLNTALSMARSTRFATSGSLDKMHLLGWSRGGQIGYAYLDAETQVPEAFRHVRGFIPVDVYLKTDVAALRSAACQRATDGQATMTSGVYQSESGALIGSLGSLAVSVPMQNSPIFAGSTNEQAALLTGAATYLLIAEPFAPLYHFTGGTWGSGGAPVTLAYTTPVRWFDFMTKASPYQPVREIYEADVSTCDNPAIADVPFDDHLAQITAPVFYVRAGGGYGDTGVYSTTLLGSQDVTTHVVQLDADRLLDVGHGDIFHGDNAEALFWQPISSWIEAH